MKKIFFMLSFVISLAACQNQAAPKHDRIEQEKTMEHAHIPIEMDSIHIHVFTCPMHPEVTGKEGGKCSKCGMALVHND